MTVDVPQRLMKMLFLLRALWAGSSRSRNGMPAPGAGFSEGEVCLKLTKRNERAMLTFEIKGYVSEGNRHVFF